MTINKILIADDNESFRETITRTFFPKEEVDYASNADEAIAKAAANRYNLIITDNQMEDGYGYSGIYAISQIRKTNTEVPIIFWTSDNSDNIYQKATEAGANVAVSKRAELAALRKTMNQYIK